MTFPPRQPLTEQQFAALLANARLDLAADRHEAVSGLLQMVNGVLDSLDR